MKRSPLKRKTPLRAKRFKTKPHANPKLAALGVETLVNYPSEAKQMIRARKRAEKKTKHAQRERAPQAWNDWLHTQPCLVGFLSAIGWAFRPLGLFDDQGQTFTPCVGGVEADHMGSKMRDGGDGTMAADRTCVSICHGHHQERHAFTGTFKNYNQESMRVFLTAGVAWMHDRARAQGVEIPNV